MAQQQSLFGPSIYDVQQQQMQQDRENAIAQAKLPPYQSIRAGMSMSGIQAGRAIAGLFGVEDPKLKEASARQELKNAISAQWDGQDPVEAYKIMAKEAARLGLTQEAISAAAQVKAAEESKAKTELGKKEVEARIGLTQAQTEASKKTTERTTEEFDYRKSQRAIEEAIKEANLTATRKTNEAKQIQYDAAKLALDKAKAEFEAMPEGFYKDRYKLQLEELRAKVNATKALADFRGKQATKTGDTRRRRMAETPIKDDMGNTRGKAVMFDDGTVERFFGNETEQPDVATQTARGVISGSNITMEQLIAERNRRKQQPGAK
jgi:hypothetical protein